MKKIIFISTLIAAFVSTPAFAVIDLTNQAGFDTFSGEIGGATAYRAVAPADPLGITGFDIAIEATTATIDGNQIIIPKVKFQKGLFAGFDVSGYYTSLPTAQLTGITKDATAYGMAVSYAFLDGDGVKPALALRGSYTQLEIPGIITTNTTGIDLTVSKEFLLISPYAGAGIINISSTGGIGSTFSSTSQANRTFFGVNLNLKIMDIAYEIDTTGGVQSQTFKLGFRF